MIQRSELERLARAVAERAVRWACIQTDGNTADWDDMDEHAKAHLMMQAMTVIAINKALEDKSAGSH